MYINQYLGLNRSFIKAALFILVTFGLIACGQEDHEPRPGEYGENLVNSIRLTPSEIQELNKSVVTKPKSSFDRGKVGIGFQGDYNQNPYRFVIVAKGTAVQQGKVELKWIGGVQSDTSNGYHPEVFQENDDHSYDPNEPVLLVISSDPFSISEKSNGMGYGVQAELMEASNFQFQSVEVQIWQGKGSKYNWTHYLQFLLILAVVIFGIHRVMSRLT